MPKLQSPFLPALNQAPTPYVPAVLTAPAIAAVNGDAVDWREKRKRRHFITSASQYETFETCERKWWLKQVRKLEEPKKGSQVFGTVLHAVAERYVNADELGRDRGTGLPVDLYPPGWHIAKAKWGEGEDGECSPIEQDLIKQLIQAAIENGILERLPGREVEKSFRKTVIQLGCPGCDGSGGTDEGTECPHCKGDGKGAHVEIQGFIDIVFRDRVDDHKSIKSMKWAKSPNKLRQNLQMLIYAKEAIDGCRARGEVVPLAVTLRHNQFCKDPDDLRVRKTEVTVTTLEIEGTWERVQQMAKRMDHWRRTAERWTDLPEPRTGNQACNAYGGCAFQSICLGQESEEGYENRLARFSSGVYHAPVQLTVQGNTPKGLDMGAFEAKLAAKQAGNAGAAPAPGQVNPPMQAPYTPPAQGPAPYAPQAPAPAPQGFQPQPQPQPAYAGPQPAAAPQGQFQQPQQPYPQQAPQQAPYQPPQQPQFQPQPQAPAPQAPAPQGQPQVTAPPWADPNCGACQGFGMNTEGNPCRICDFSAAQRGRLAPGAYNLQQIGGGLFQWVAKDGTHSGVSMLSPSSKPGVVADARTPSPAAPTHQGPVPQGTPETEEEGEEKGKGAKGRPPKSFLLCINCGPIRGVTTRGDRSVIYLDQLLNSMAAEIATQYKAPSFYDIDAFARRDILSKLAPEAVKGFGTCLVVATGIGTGMTDAKALLDAIKPYAGMVIIGENQ
jgi:hypothetical protein